MGKSSAPSDGWAGGFPARLGPCLAIVASVAAVLVLASPAAAATAPSIEGESVSNITQTDATLEADINPNGLAATYRFRLAYGCGLRPQEACPQFCIAEQPCPGPWNSVIVVPLPIGTLPALSEIEHVSLDLNSVGVTLEPYEYRYSVEATNAAGTAVGPAQFFRPSSGSPAPAGTPPSIEGESASKITAIDATLEAQINPGGLETSYEFRLETPECQIMVGPGPTRGCQLAGSGNIPAGSSTQTVSTDIADEWQNLVPDSRYLYFVRAVNTAGEVFGDEREFTTLPASSPSIEGESVSNITPADATLEAQINTGSLETTYTFYLRQEGPACLKAEPPCEVLEKEPTALPTGKLLGSSVGQDVSADLNSAGISLTPGSSYEYWVTATNAVGTAEGQHQSFSTPAPADAEPLSEPGDSTSGQDPSGAQTAPSTAPNAHRQRRWHRHRHRQGSHHRHGRRHHRARLHRAKRAS